MIAEIHITIKPKNKHTLTSNWITLHIVAVCHINEDSHVSCTWFSVQHTPTHTLTDCPKG